MRRAPGGSVSTALVRPLVHALEGSAAGKAELFRASDLTAEMLADPDARVSPAQFCVAWATAVQLTGTPTLALRIAEAMPVGAFGIVEYVCRSVPTLGDGLAQWCRYLGILDDAVLVGLVDEGPRTALRVIRESDAPAPASHELCFALVVKHARAMLQGELRVSEVSFTHRVSPVEAREHDAFFGIKVRWGRPHTELVFPESVLATPLASADPHLLEVLRPAADDKRARVSSRPPLTEQVRRALQGALSQDEAQLETVAKRLGMTGRSLQRRLRDEGTVFQTVRDGARKDLADRYLGQGMSFAEISFLLGFSEPSAFFRAFKRWTGLTPFERRAALTG
jgi:AraC-like DNA-binding protein